jgi:ethanolamine utilization protein EutQ (cupin superfamily)
MSSRHTSTSHLNQPLCFRSGNATAWMAYEGTSLADVLNEDEHSTLKLGAVGFLRAPAGVTTAFDFEYDEALIVTRGHCTVRAPGTEVSAGPGEVIYLPAHVAGTFHTDADTELVYVASSPYGAVNREAKRALLSQS